MINNVSIQHFKGIGNCTLDDIGRINILVGRNDSCKSTILEAIYHTLKEPYGTSIGTIFKRRTNVFTSAQELWYNYDMRESIDVQLELSDYRLNMQINEIEKLPRTLMSILAKTTLENTKSDMGIKTILLENIYNQELNPIRSSPRFKKTSTNPSELDTFCKSTKYIDSSDRNDVYSTEAILGKIKLNGKAREFGQYLFSMYGRGKMWEFLPHPLRPSEYRLAFMDTKKPIFLSGLGDGIRYGMQIIGNIIDSKNTVIFIEEIETNQHAESLRLLIDFLVEIAFKNDVQLFITTHRDSVLQCFWNAFRKEEHTEDQRATEIRYVHVERDQKTGNVTCNNFDPHNAQDRCKIMGDLCGLEKS